ncbi:hypothetical protein HYH03_013404 [Edaphochlamys debaryana]|uniref:Uncharacterized protein n=1 Tax=Edaphochlamys debaryana TaxID=47281 RepID=A0A835XQQ3_9CHLO|nr:hypothetical protein HYH03_013404 [Edaphochlamys debaryana]|eukprot:KAG2487964.1 hypothetical protein HYH03_013404 [Edaphochlamys debaryana]
MSRLSRALRRHPPRGLLACLIASTKTVNILLLFVGFALSFYAGDLVATRGASLPVPPAWPASRLPASALALAALGLLAVAAATSALGAAALHSLPLLSAHLALLAVLLATQVCGAAALIAMADRDAAVGVTAVTAVTTTSATAAATATDLPGGKGPGLEALDWGLWAGGAAGGGAAVAREVQAALAAYPWADAAALAVEVAALILGCLLHSAYTRADDQAEDEEEAAVLDPTVPLLGARWQQPGATAGAAGSPGPRRSPPVAAAQAPLDTAAAEGPRARLLRERYGVTSAAAVDEEAEEGGARGCVVS